MYGDYFNLVNCYASLSTIIMLAKNIDMLYMPCLALLNVNTNSRGKYER